MPASRPTARCSSALAAPSSSISPSTANRRVAGPSARAAERRRHRCGVGVVASLTTVTPFASGTTCMRRPTGARGSRARHDGLERHADARAAAAAASAFRRCAGRRPAARTSRRVAPRCRRNEAAPPSVTVDLVGAHLAARRRSGRAARKASPSAATCGIVGIHDGRAPRPHAREELALGLARRPRSSRGPRGAPADAGDDADVGSGDLGEPTDLAGRVHAHLEHRGRSRRPARPRA